MPPKLVATHKITVSTNHLRNSFKLCFLKSTMHRYWNCRHHLTHCAKRLSLYLSLALRISPLQVTNKIPSSSKFHLDSEVLTRHAIRKKMGKKQNHSVVVNRHGWWNHVVTSPIDIFLPKHPEVHLATYHFVTSPLHVILNVGRNNKHLNNCCLAWCWSSSSCHWDPKAASKSINLVLQLEQKWTKEMDFFFFCLCWPLSCISLPGATRNCACAAWDSILQLDGFDARFQIRPKA